MKATLDTQTIEITFKTPRNASWARVQDAALEAITQAAHMAVMTAPSTRTPRTVSWVLASACLEDAAFVQAMRLSSQSLGQRLEREFGVKPFYLFAGEPNPEKAHSQNAQLHRLKLQGFA